MTRYLTYLYLLTPLHTGGSSQEGNLMGIAREVHTEFPYLPASSLRGKIRSEYEREPADGKPDLRDAASSFFGQKIKGEQQPTEGDVWFADATLLFFPIASLNHHLVWITCPLWLERFNRWLMDDPLRPLIDQCRSSLSAPPNKQRDIAAVVSFDTSKLYLQTALLEKSNHLEVQNFDLLSQQLTPLLGQGNGLISQLTKKLVVLTDEDCIALVETGLQREVRVALKDKEKTVQGGSFRSEEAIPPEAVLFFPWGTKPPKRVQPDPNLAKQDAASAEADVRRRTEMNTQMRQALPELLKGKLQFGGLEGLGRGWTQTYTTTIAKES